MSSALALPRTLAACSQPIRSQSTQPMLGSSPGESEEAQRSSALCEMLSTCLMRARAYRTQLACVDTVVRSSSRAESVARPPLELNLRFRLAPSTRRSVATRERREVERIVRPPPIAAAGTLSWAQPNLEGERETHREERERERADRLARGSSRGCHNWAWWTLFFSSILPPCLADKQSGGTELPALVGAFVRRSTARFGCPRTATRNSLAQPRLASSKYSKASHASVAALLPFSSRHRPRPSIQLASPRRHPHPLSDHSTLALPTTPTLDPARCWTLSVAWPPSHHPVMRLSP